MESHTPDNSYEEWVMLDALLDYARTSDQDTALSLELPPPFPEGGLEAIRRAISDEVTFAHSRDSHPVLANADEPPVNVADIAREAIAEQVYRAEYDMVKLESSLWDHLVSLVAETDLGGPYPIAMPADLRLGGIIAEEREKRGKGSGKALRRLGKVAVTVYGREHTWQAQVSRAALHEAFEEKATGPLKIWCKGSWIDVLGKSLRHNNNPDLWDYVELVEVAPDQIVEAAVPLAMSIQNEGYVMRSVAVRCRAQASQMPRTIYVTHEAFKDGRVAHAADLELPDGVEIAMKRARVVVAELAETSTEGTHGSAQAWGTAASH